MMTEQENIQTKPTSSIQRFIEGHGYYTDTHEVQTKDGYILTLWRLLKRSENSGDIEIIPKKKPVALIVNGLLCHGGYFCMINPEIGLPYMLLNEGYDCWLLHNRGTPLSRKHVSLSTSSKSYWNFSFHELGMFDLPATINYILETTDNSSLSYIGHSLGCSVLFVLLSTKSEYCSKVNVMLALAPGGYGAHITSIGFKSFIMFGNAVGGSKFIWEREVAKAPLSKSLKFIVTKSKRDRIAGWCAQVFGEIMGGLGKRGIEKDRLCWLASEYPSPTSMKVLCHSFQCLKSNKTRQYNYGRAGNIKMYGQPKPPFYDLHKVNIPIAIICSVADGICPPADAAKLSKQFPNVIHHFCIEDDDFSHCDFIMGKDAHKLVYNRVIQILTEIKNQKL